MATYALCVIMEQLSRNGIQIQYESEQGKSQRDREVPSNVDCIFCAREDKHFENSLLCPKREVISICIAVSDIQFMNLNSMRWMLWECRGFPSHVFSVHAWIHESINSSIILPSVSALYWFGFQLQINFGLDLWLWGTHWRLGWAAAVCARWMNAGKSNNVIALKCNRFRICCAHLVVVETSYTLQVLQATDKLPKKLELSMTSRHSTSADDD